MVTGSREVWFLTGSQGLYGDETLRQVAAQSQHIARGLTIDAELGVGVVWKPVLTDASAIRRACLNMRDVAVTEGDKVAAQLRFGASVNTYGVNDLVAVADTVADERITDLVKEYEDAYLVAAELRRDGARHESLRYAARIELALRDFLAGRGPDCPHYGRAGAAHRRPDRGAAQRPPSQPPSCSPSRNDTARCGATADGRCRTG